MTEVDLITELLAKTGLIIGAFFCLCPLPQLYTALTKDKNALKSLSVPGCIMGLSCSTVILAYSEMNGMGDSAMSCWMYIGSCLLSLVVYTVLNN